ncbi:MAG: radical SAM protein [Promethearchaeota archaeon]|nr:MAG: radical SAM protein [Candidatus Lokiarchaeota archaeon]
MTEEIIRRTTSICPECLQTIPAEIYVDPATNFVMMRKNCKEHGDFKDKLSIDPEEYKWGETFTDNIGSTINNSTKPEYTFSGIKEIKKGCPYDCGLCDNHKSAPNICLIDITNRCNLTCPICFANASAKGYVVEPTFDQIVQIMEHFRSMKPVAAVLLQISGGEPTVRDDLPDIIRKGKELGFTEVMVTTNGVRFAKSIDFMKKCMDAGMDAIYLQFDATDNPEVWKKIRGVNLWPLKQKVVENARKIGFFGMMLVPVIAKGVNDKEIGKIMDYAKDNTDVISGIVFQPVSLCGRISFEELMDLRYTTSDLKVAINKHTNNAIDKFYPIATTAKMTRLLAWFDDVAEFGMTSHKDCGFATIIVVNEKDQWEPIEKYFDAEGLIRWSNKVYDMVQDREIPKPTGFLKGVNLEDFGTIASTVGKFIDDMTDLGYRQMMKAYYFAGATRFIKNPEQILTSKTLQGFARLVASPNLASAANFLHTKNLMVSAMHFQDAYNFDLDRVCRCLVHYGVIDPDDNSKVLEVPFCAMNTLHRERLELANAIQGAEAKKPEVIQSEIKELLETVKD